MASKVMGFRPADHHRDFLNKLPDRSAFIRQAIDFYLAQNDKKDVRMIAIENQIENLEKKIDVILSVLSGSSFPVRAEAENEGNLPSESENVEVNPMTNDTGINNTNESEETMFYFADSLGSFAD